MELIDSISYMEWIDSISNTEWIDSINNMESIGSICFNIMYHFYSILTRNLDIKTN